MTNIDQAAIAFLEAVEAEASESGKLDPDGWTPELRDAYRAVQR
jgi:hypothetical protein